MAPDVNGAAPAAPEGEGVTSGDGDDGEKEKGGKPADVEEDEEKVPVRSRPYKYPSAELK